MSEGGMEALTSDVNRLLAEGWRPCGGLVVHQSRVCCEESFCQAMVRDKPARTADPMDAPIRLTVDELKETEARAEAFMNDLAKKYGLVGNGDMPT